MKLGCFITLLPALLILAAILWALATVAMGGG